MTQMPLFEAKCGTCGRTFGHPDHGDFSYGEEIFYTADGKNYVTVTAFTQFAQKVATLVKATGSKGEFWAVLASLADPVAGKPLVIGIRCPNCSSTSLEYWGGEKVGAANVASASFSAASTLSSELLAERIAASAVA